MSAKFEVRPAQSSEWAWIRRLAVEVCEDSLPPGSRVSPQALRARVRARYSQLDPRDVVCLVAWHQEKQVRCGYLILQLAQTDAVTGEAQSAIYDLAVEPRFQGTAAVGALVRAAAKVTAEHGLARMQGDITVTNLKAFKKALRLGFTLQRYSLTMDCSGSVQEI